MRRSHFLRHTVAVGALPRWALCAILLPACPIHAALHPRLASLVNRDTTVHVWVVFSDKQQSAPPPGAPGLGKRGRVFTRADLPVTGSYLTNVERLGARRRQIFKWANAASFSVSSALLPRLAALPNVTCVLPVRSFPRLPRPLARGMGKSLINEDGRYGGSYTQLAQIDVPYAHGFLTNYLNKTPGEGITVAVFDNGFTLSHRCFLYVNSHNAILGDSDFVDHDGDVTYPDGHGTQTLSLIAGYDPGAFLGCAWGARFLLARTEDDASEHHVEEDNWAAAAVWATEAGADIISSSLGYRYGFDTLINGNPTTVDYSFQSMDGATTIISIAAREATRHGVVVVNAIGNEADSGTGSLNAPADVPDVVSVGAVDAGGKIAGFSSLGPTTDGRIKPDLVAMGVSVLVPLFNTQQSYVWGSGTSFSTPMAAGVCALIMQAHPGDSAGLIRGFLYESCNLTPFQQTVDNTYGRGIPDAYVACVMQPRQLSIGPSQAQVFVRRFTGIPVASVTVSGPGSLTALTDSLGSAGLTFETTPPETLTFAHSSTDFGTALVLQRLPQRRAVTLTIGWFTVFLEDLSGESPRRVAGEVLWQKPGSSVWDTIRTDSGEARIQYGVFGNYEIQALAQGYSPSPLTAVVLGQQPDTLHLALQPRAAGLTVYPTVVRLRPAAPAVHYTLVANDPSLTANVEVRSAAGQVVWSEVKDGPGPFSGTWNCRTPRGRWVAPGSYVLIVRCAEMIHKRKLLIIPE